ncbi:hypothetical protein [Candidatus Nanoperiomorbus periodonticus]|uniref:hypothetical protein n=1 Tax=Candidatus Nanoperiomorbus periodonticus TaxID=2171989 RepID=UPI00101C5FE3|nr:hypothetical protein [Candidatus Nanoperiomorbus periodonticus]RYC76219.1 hypothetical protein G51EAM_00359 [Candidatus Nanoperiomorbus periodonticus]
MKNKYSGQGQSSDERGSVAGSWQLSQDEAKELERRQQVLLGLSELNQSDPGGARAIPDIVFHNISPSRQRQLAEEYPARNSQGASKGHLDYVGAIKEGLNDEEFATLENSFHAYINLPAELQQKWQGDLRASKPDSDKCKTRGEYKRAYTAWTAEGLCSLKKLAEEVQAAGYQHSESNPKPAAVKPEANPEPKQQGVEPQPQPIVGPETNPEPKSKGEFQSQPQQQKPVIQEKAEDKPNPTDEKNWDNIENRRAVVRRLTMLGDAESAVVEEAMAKSVYREYSLASLAFFESDGKASPSLAKRQHELYDDLKLARDKFSDSDTSTIFKVVSNFSNEQMDDLDKLVDEVAILAEKDPQGMERLRSNVRERSHELADEVHETALSDSLSSKEYHKREADLVGNFYSSVITQAREAVKGKSRGEGQGSEQSNATSQPEPAPQPGPEVNPSSGQESEKEQPESPTKGKSRGEGQGNAKLTQEKAEDAPNPADEKDWDNIENRRAVVGRLTMLGDEEIDVVREVMAESVYREVFLVSLAMLESKGKARASLEKRREELFDDWKRTLNIMGKFSDSDTSAISKVISNFSYEQMDDLDKLVDAVTVLAEKDPQGMERLRSDVTERSHELIDEVDEMKFSDSLSDEEKCKRAADLIGNSHSSIIAQTREAAEAATRESKPKPAVKPEVIPEPKSKREFQPQPQQQKSEKEQPESPTKGKSRGEGQGSAKLTREKAEDASNPTDEKNWDSIENRRAVVRRLTMLGAAESAVVREAMKESVYREDCLADLAMLESDGKARASLKKRREELDDDYERILDIRGKFSDSDPSTILKVISNFSYEQMDDLDKLVDAVAILAEKDPQGMERLCSDVRERSDELAEEAREIAVNDSLSDRGQCKRLADLAGNFYSSIIDQTREAAEPIARKSMSEYVGEQVLNDKMRSELLKQAFIRSLGQERLAELRQQYGGEVNSAAEMIVKSIRDADGLNGKECYRLNGLLNDLDALPDSDIRRIIQSDIFKNGVAGAKNRSGTEGAGPDFSAELRDLIHQKAERIRQTEDLRQEYQNASPEVCDATGVLVERDKFVRYDESSSKDRGDILLNQLDNKPEGIMSDALMSRDGINLLTEEEIASYRKHLAMAKELSVDSIDELLGFDDDLDDLKEGAVPSDIRKVLEKYQNGGYPGSPEERQAYNQAQAKLYQMAIDKVNELAKADREKAGLEEFLAPRRKLTDQIFNRNVDEGARSLLYTELMMKSFSKERYEEVLETFRNGERTQFGDFIQCRNASEPGVPDPRGMTQEEFERLAELTPLVLGLSKSQIKQLLESEEKEKTRLSKGDPNDPELWQKRQQYSATLEQRIRRMVRDNDAENINMASVDRSRIVEMKAYIDAKRKLDKDLMPKPEDFNAKGKLKLGARVRGAVARLWKGKIFRDYYEFKYQRELKEQYSKDFAHTLGANSGDGSASSAETEQALIWRMTQDSDFFTDTVGEEREQLSPDSEAYKAMRQAVETFVENGNEEAFIEETRRINNDLMGNEGMPILDNYLTSAIYIKGQVDHGRALNDVMRGFKMYQGTSAEGVNSGHHERAIDKLVAKFERKKTGKTLFIKPEVVAGVAGLASWIGGAVARNRAVQAISFGGSAVVAGVLAGVKENEQVKIDRADLARRIAEGGQVDEDNKYEMELAETIPEMRTAESYMEAMDQAITSGDADQMRQVLADLVVAREVGRNEGVDLIDYYSGGGDAEEVRNELTSRQFALEQAYIRANEDPNLELGRYKSQLMDGLGAATQAYGEMLHDVNGALLSRDNVPDDVRKQISEAYEAQAARDMVARKLRHRRVAKEVAVTTARTLAFSTIMQEGLAFIRDDVHGAVEDMLAGQHGDAPNAARTALGNLLNTPSGGAVGEVVAGGNQPEKQFYREGEIDHEQIKQWQAEGYKVEKHFDYEPQEHQVTISAEDAVKGNPTFHRAGWLDYGTERPDYNELLGHHGEGSSYIFNPRGGSYGYGMSMSREDIIQAAREGHIKLMVSPTRGTQSNPFSVGNVIVEDNGLINFNPDAITQPAAADMMVNRSYAFAEVVDDRTGMVLATEVGSGTADSFTQTAKEMVNTLTGYDITPPVDRVISSVPVTPDVEPLPPVPGYRGTRRLSTDDELFERPAGAETPSKEEVNPSAQLPPSEEEVNQPAQLPPSKEEVNQPAPTQPSGSSSPRSTARWWQGPGAGEPSALSDKEKRERSDYMERIVKQFKQEFIANEGEDNLGDVVKIEQFARDKGLGRLIDLSDQKEPVLNAYGEIVSGWYDDRKAWQEDAERRQDFYDHANSDGYGPELLDYLAKKSGQPEYSTDKVVSWEEPKITKGDLQSNVKERGLTASDHIVYDSLFTGVNEDRKLTDLGRAGLAQELSNRTVDEIDQLGATGYIGSFKAAIDQGVDYINKEISDMVEEKRLTDEYLGGARELLGTGSRPGTYVLNTLGQIALSQFHVDFQPGNNDETEYSLDSFVNRYNTKYSDKQKANWRAMVQREQKYLNDVNTLARELGDRIGRGDIANIDLNWSLYGDQFSVNSDVTQSIERYLSECQVDGKEASVDDFVKGYDAGLYRD